MKIVAFYFALIFKNAKRKQKNNFRGKVLILIVCRKLDLGQNYLRRFREWKASFSAHIKVARGINDI
ncbi:MAG: hypothetical protein LBI30_02690 [Holosporales bacterium]|jgi:hypothetical protein|nr:hypothetical protein [Holosporales bacterium]